MTTLCTDHPAYDSLNVLEPGNPFIEGIFRSMIGILDDEDLMKIAPDPSELIKSCLYMGSFEHEECVALRYKVWIYCLLVFYKTLAIY